MLGVLFLVQFHNFDRLWAFIRVTRSYSSHPFLCAPGISYYMCDGSMHACTHTHTYLFLCRVGIGQFASISKSYHNCGLQEEGISTLPGGEDRREERGEEGEERTEGEERRKERGEEGEGYEEGERVRRKERGEEEESER